MKQFPLPDRIWTFWHNMSILKKKTMEELIDGEKLRKAV